MQVGAQLGTAGHSWAQLGTGPPAPSCASHATACTHPTGPRRAHDHPWRFFFFAHAAQVIQDTVRRAFAGCTLLIIAHRLATIMDADRVLVLEQGRAVECAPPVALLAEVRAWAVRLQMV